ncbi:hypothetical protein FCL47_22165 [Desulfopila sp. IMCC35006]|uniref:hypothetical protein n=1 Tax=Desulfopila sp. IMCC35006 TaxID=2569542 RepID=UPI0010AC99D0|nr:hypothetical protein [Desulfopila sp. IMCC35006]TKB23466.1 hypothetical protein FCL47_22165 [Desulfopila sp. IMCC35006]
MSPKTSNNILLSVLAGAILAARTVLFFLMFWLRGIVLSLSGVVSFLTLFVCLFSFYAFPEKPQMAWGFATASLVSFVVGWLYDSILMTIAPQDLVSLYL